MFTKVACRPLSWTSTKSFIPLVFRLLVTLPLSDLEWKTFKDIFVIWEIKAGKRGPTRRPRLLLVVSRYPSSNSCLVSGTTEEWELAGNLTNYGRNGGPSNGRICYTFFFDTNGRPAIFGRDIEPSSCYFGSSNDVRLYRETIFAKY